jgi:hypothetical protein
MHNQAEYRNNYEQAVPYRCFPTLADNSLPTVMTRLRDCYRCRTALISLSHNRIRLAIEGLVSLSC